MNSTVKKLRSKVYSGKAKEQCTTEENLKNENYSQKAKELTVAEAKEQRLQRKI